MPVPTNWQQIQAALKKIVCRRSGTSKSTFFSTPVAPRKLYIPGSEKMKAAVGKQHVNDDVLID